MADIPGLDNLMTSASGSIIYWGGYVFMGLIVGALVFAVVKLRGFNIQAIIWPVTGSGTGNMTIGKPIFNKFKWNGKRTAWIKKKPLFSKKEYPPFEQKYIYPGNRIYCYEINGELIPAEIHVNRTKHIIGEDGEEQILADPMNVNPVPYHLREWQAMEHKKNMSEYSNKDWFNENKQFIMTIGAVLFCCVLCGVTIYLAFKFAGGGVSSMNSLTDAIKGLGQIPGVGPS